MFTPERRRRRAGIALAMTVVAMAVLGALITGLFFASMREYRDGRDALERTRALAAAEYGLHATLAPTRWLARWNTDTGRGRLAGARYALGGATDSVEVWKVAPTGFVVISEGRAGVAEGRARRRVSLLVALRPPRLDPPAVVTSTAPPAVAGGSEIVADDTPASSSCPPAGALLPATAQLSAGELERRLDAVGAASAGGRLAPGATLLAPAPSVDATGACDEDDPRNLGDPLRQLGAASPCADYAPVLRTGTLHLSGGVGQGLLVVDGDLTIDAGAEFFGAVIVRGTLELTGGAHLYGVAFAARVSLDDHALIHFSRCALARARLAAAVPVVPRGAAWVEMY